MVMKNFVNHSRSLVVIELRFFSFPLLEVMKCRSTDKLYALYPMTILHYDASLLFLVATSTAFLMLLMDALAFHHQRVAFYIGSLFNLLSTAWGCCIFTILMELCNFYNSDHILRTSSTGDLRCSCPVKLILMDDASFSLLLSKDRAEKTDVAAATLFMLVSR